MPAPWTKHPLVTIPRARTEVNDPNSRGNIAANSKAVQVKNVLLYDIVTNHELFSSSQDTFNLLY
jgi:hypothetical protein